MEPLLRLRKLLGRPWGHTQGHRLPLLHLYPYRRLRFVLLSNAPATNATEAAPLAPSSLACSRSTLQTTTCTLTQAIPVIVERHSLEGSVAKRLLQSTSRIMLHVNTKGSPKLNDTRSKTCTYPQRQVVVAPLLSHLCPENFSEEPSLVFTSKRINFHIL